MNSVKLRNRLEAGMKLDKVEGEGEGEGETTWTWLPVPLPTEEEEEEIKQQGLYAYTDFIYGKYNKDPDKQDVYMGFRNIDRLKLILLKFEVSYPRKQNTQNPGLENEYFLPNSTNAPSCLQSIKLR